MDTSQKRAMKHTDISRFIRKLYLRKSRWSVRMEMGDI